MRDLSLKTGERHRKHRNGNKVVEVTSALMWARPPPLRLVGRLAPPRDMVSMETLRPRIALCHRRRKHHISPGGEGGANARVPRAHATLMDSSSPPWAWPFSARPSSSDDNPSMLWERRCSSSWRLSSRAARVRSYAHTRTHTHQEMIRLGTTGDQARGFAERHFSFYFNLMLKAYALMHGGIAPLAGRSGHSCTRRARR